MKKLRWITALTLLLVAAPAFAYLDPGTGSMLLQVILGGVAAIGVAVKLFWYKIRAALGFRKATDAGDDKT